MAITAGGSLNSVALPQKQAATSNYLDLASTAKSGLGATIFTRSNGERS